MVPCWPTDVDRSSLVEKCRLEAARVEKEGRGRGVGGGVGGGERRREEGDRDGEKERRREGGKEEESHFIILQESKSNSLSHVAGAGQPSGLS